MQDGVITIHGHKRDRLSTIRVHLSFDVPEQMMQMLIDELSAGVKRWEDKIIMYKNEKI